jgi:hypothetical protein
MRLRRELISCVGDDTSREEPEQALERFQIVRRSEVVDEGQRRAHSGGLGPVARIAK